MPPMKLDTPKPSDFDPYYRWLGIPRGQRPPSHYRLLGISPKEEDTDLIKAAVERQTLLVKNQKQPEQEPVATRLLYEIQEAGMVLLDPYRRKQYDAFLEQAKPVAKQRSIPEPFPPYTPTRPVGEGNEIVRTYFGVMSIILGGFIIMAVVSFMLPWRKVVFGIQEPKATVEARDAKAKADNDPQPPIQAAKKLEVGKAVVAQPKDTLKAVAAKQATSPQSFKKNDGAVAGMATVSDDEFEQSVVGKYRLELTSVKAGEHDRSNTLDLHSDNSVTVSDGHKGQWGIKGRQLVLTIEGFDIQPATGHEDGTFTGEATDKSNRRKGHYILTKIQANPSPKLDHARWVLEHGGSVAIVVGAEERTITPGDKLPTGEFDVVGVNLKGRRDISDGDLEKLSEFSELRNLVLMETGITNDGLSHLERLTTLEILNLAATSISDDGLAHLSGLQRLQALYFGGCPIHGEGLVHLKSLPQLRLLGLINTKMADAGLAHLQDIHTLAELRLGGDHITDGGIQYLVKMHQLRKLGLANTKVSASGMKRLRRVLKQCEIEGRK
jgi:hypothetical protein